MHRFNSLQKAVDDLLWFHRMGDIARVDKVRMTGPPSKVKNPTAQGAVKSIVFWSYTFMPRAWNQVTSIR